jgi:hypothetical protein
LAEICGIIESHIKDQELVKDGGKKEKNRPLERYYGKRVQKESSQICSNSKI